MLWRHVDGRWPSLIRKKCCFFSKQQWEVIGIALQCGTLDSDLELIGLTYCKMLQDI